MTTRGQALAAALLSLGTQACATIWSLSPDRVEGHMYESARGPGAVPRVYSGVVADALCAVDQGSGEIGGLCILDLPLSVCADTLVLPWTLFTQIRSGNYRPRLVPEIHARAEEQREEGRRRALYYCRVHRPVNEHEAELCRTLDEKPGAPPETPPKAP